MFTIFGQRYHKHDPFVEQKTGDVIDTGEPVKIKLGEFADETIANNFAANVKSHTLNRTWKIWIETTP
jgi:hypothetical protein